MKDRTSNPQTRKWLAAGGLGLIAALVCLGIFSGTLARYTYTEDLHDSARVAVFDVSVGDGSRTFKLFDTILDSDNSAEEDVAKAGPGETAIIAPGTRGSFDLVLNNNSEVTVDYAVDISVGDTEIPLQFSTDGTSWTDDFTSALHSGTLNIGATSQTVTVHWQWPFDSKNDTLDTSLGLAAQNTPATVAVTADVSFVQKD